MSNLKEKTIIGLIWSTIERLGYSFIMFFTNIFLARLLLPEDFGSVVLILVFVSFANIIVESGFSTALIQKKEITQLHCNTVFWINLFVSMIIYFTIYYFAPLVAQFYEIELLSSLLRVISLCVLINALGIVQLALLKKRLEFRKLSYISIISSLIGGVIGVSLAIKGYGPWCLVFQMLAISAFRVLLLFIFSNWYPRISFSYKSFLDLYRYGSMVFLTQVIDVIYQNTIPLILGKAFTPKIVGNFNQAKSLESVPNQTLITIVNQVTFPVFSIIQDEEDKLKFAVRKCMNILSWITFPLMIILIIIAKPLFVLLYTEKWLGAVEFFQIICFGGMFNFIVQVNLSLLLALGYSKLAFWSRFYRQFLCLLLIILGLSVGGMKGLLFMGFIIGPFLSVLISIYYISKVFNYGLKEQINDIIKPLIIGISLGLIIFYLTNYVNNYFLLIGFRGLLFVLLYLIISKFLKLPSYIYVVKELNNIYRNYAVNKRNK